MQIKKNIIQLLIVVLPVILLIHTCKVKKIKFCEAHYLKKKINVSTRLNVIYTNALKL